MVLLVNMEILIYKFKSLATLLLFMSLIKDVNMETASSEKRENFNDPIVSNRFIVSTLV